MGIHVFLAIAGGHRRYESSRANATRGRATWRSLPSELDLGAEAFIEKGSVDELVSKIERLLFRLRENEKHTLELAGAADVLEVGGTTTRPFVPSTL